MTTGPASQDGTWLAGWLRQARAAAGMTQEELAERSGVGVRAIGDLERGRTRKPYARSIRYLAAALGVPFPGQLAGRAVVPRQLPAPVRHFTGRRAELRLLTGLLDRAGAAPGPVLITAIDGMAGVGKTALAVHWAHQVADRFPDGQLYVNLRGFHPSGEPMSSAVAIRGLLDALQVPAEQIPAGPDAQAGLYRSLLSGRRMLVVLDNARDAGQVRPLLPGSSGCLAVVTSRSQLAGLAAAEGARQLTLDLLTEAEARELLARRLGVARLDVEPGAAAELIGLCARLPLALVIASARPCFSLSALVAELRDARGRLDVLDTRDPAACVRAAFSWSYQELTNPAAAMFRLLGLHPGPDISARAAASLTGTSPSQARQQLGELIYANLITEHSPGRYAMHDLFRAYAIEQATATDDDQARAAAVGRALDHYLHTAHAAAVLMQPHRNPPTLGPAQPGVTPERLADHRQALAWFESEHHVLLAAAALAADTGLDVQAWQLPWAMASYLDWRGHWREWIAVQRTALAAATHLGDTTAQAAAHRGVAAASARLGDHNQARAHLTECLSLYRQLGDRAGEARVHQDLVWGDEEQGRHADALGHAEQALALFRALADRAGQANTLNSVGWCHAMLGNHQQARTFCQQALGLFCELGNRYGEAHTWASLGYVEHQLGQLTEADDCYHHALSMFLDLGDRFYQAAILRHLGDTHHAARDQDKAQDAWRRALAILDDLQHPDADQVRAKLGHPAATPQPRGRSGS